MQEGYYNYIIGLTRFLVLPRRRRGSTEKYFSIIYIMNPSLVIAGLTRNLLIMDEIADQVRNDESFCLLYHGLSNSCNALLVKLHINLNSVNLLPKSM